MDPAAAFKSLATPWEGGDVDAFDDVMAPALRYHMPPFEDQDLASLKEFVAGFAQSFPDFSVTADDTIVEGDQIVYRWSCEATLSGESPVIPVPPTGRRTSATGTLLCRVADDRFVEVWHHGDWLGWLQKAGVIEGLG